jgi:uncharacterized protein YceH (UPF0502 family)
MHLLSGDKVPAGASEPAAEVGAAPGASAATYGERITQLETEVSELRRELETLREQFSSFQKQFQ